MHPTLTDGAARYEFLPPEAGEPRGDERPRTFHGAAEAARLLERFSPAALDRDRLAALLGPEQSFALSRRTDRELRDAVAARLAEGKLRLVEVPADATLRLPAGQGALRVLRWPDRPRPGESVRSFSGVGDALRFLERLHADVWTRRGVEDVAYRLTSSARTEPVAGVLRRFAEQLALGGAQVVRPSEGIAWQGGPSSNGVQPAPVVAEMAPQFQLCDIPDVMDRMLGWPVAARVMRRWFQTDAHILSPAMRDGSVDPRLIPAARFEGDAVSIQWALGFARVSRARWEVMAGDWDTERGRDRLKRLVVADYLSQPGRVRWRFGNLTRPAREVDGTCQVNIKRVGGLLDPLDDFYGAVGRGTLKVAVSGMVTLLSPRRLRMVVDRIGVYLRDAYEFTDPPGERSQPLGTWGFDGVSRWASGPPIRVELPYNHPVGSGRRQVAKGSSYEVTNRSFFDYRERHRRGGDFVIFSNLHHSAPPTPVTIDMSF